MSNLNQLLNSALMDGITEEGGGWSLKGGIAPARPERKRTPTEARAALKVAAKERNFPLGGSSKTEEIPVEVPEETSTPASKSDVVKDLYGKGKVKAIELGGKGKAKAEELGGKGKAKYNSLTPGQKIGAAAVPAALAAGLGGLALARYLRRRKKKAAEKKDK